MMEIKVEAEQIIRAVRSSIKEELGAYKMPKEQHYVDHVWIKEQRDWQAKIRSWSIASVISVIVSAVAYIIYLGLVAARVIK